MLPPLALAPRPGEAAGQQKRLSGPTDRPHGLCAGQRAHARAAGHPAGQSAPVQSAPGRHLLLQRRKPALGPGLLERHPDGPALLRLGHGGKASPCAQTLAGRQAEQPDRPATAPAAPRRLPARAGRASGILHLHHQRGGKRSSVRFAEEELGLVRETLSPFPALSGRNVSAARAPCGGDGEKSQAQGFYLALLRKTAECGNADATAQTASGPRKGREGRDAGRALSPECLAGPCCDPALLPEPPRPDAALVLDDIADLTALLSSQSRQTGLAGREAALWWRDLLLGRVPLKQGRAVATFK